MKFIVAFLALLAFVFALARFSRSAGLRRAARLAMRVTSYLLAALAILMAWLAFFSQDYGTLTMLVLAILPALGAGLTFRLADYCAMLEKEWFSQG